MTTTLIPSLSARQLQDTLVDYIQATLAFSDQDLRAAFEDRLRAPDGLFRGPYVRLGLPFVTAPKERSPLTISPDFDPYAHQLRAFEQLHTGGAETPSNTLVTTGTGSGKTEAFLYPILDHCWRHRGEPGVKAILIYPMNALATDQARRLASILASNRRLGGVRAGLYIGGEGAHADMSADHLIEDKQRMRSEPPDILLTNYKMLDFMLLRPDERPLWERNTPDTLRYLVLDELHTFDGAQGSDVACLIRRLKARLGTPPNHLVCAGTSATIGDSADTESFEQLAAFAELIFGERFEARHILREQRLERSRFLPRPKDDLPLAPRLDDTLRAALDPPVGAEPLDYLAAAQRAWLGTVHEDRVALGSDLLAHPLLTHLLALTAERPAETRELLADLGDRVPDLGRLQPADRRIVIDAFLALISHARRREGTRVVPLLTVQVQLWARELRRLLRVLPDQDGTSITPPRFEWDSVAPDGSLDGVLLAHQAVCRECGLAGLAARQNEQDAEHHRLGFAASATGEAWATRSRHARFVWPRPLDPAAREGQLVHWLHPGTGSLAGEPFVSADGRPVGVPVVVEATLTQKSKRFRARCPRCGSFDALSIVGARAASLSSVAVTHLFQAAPTQDEQKLLAFTDSVQDASHRAGFFGGRTYRIHLRTAIATVIEQAGPLPLSGAARAFEAHWRPRLGDRRYLAAFLPHDLHELPEFEAFQKAEGQGKHPRLWEILRDRIGWEITREFGVAAGIGRSLERTGVATAEVDEDRVDAAAGPLAAWLETQEWPVDKDGARHFLRGLVHRLRHMGGIHHRFLEGYVGNLGARFFLTKRKNPYIHPMGPRSRRLRFYCNSPQGDTFPSLAGKKATVGWPGDWVRRSLGRPLATSVELVPLLRQAMRLLADHGVVRATTAGKATVWGLRPEALLLTCDLAALRASRSRVDHVARRTAEGSDGRPAWHYRSQRTFVKERLNPGYYATIYQRGDTARVRPGEHTGLLDRETRTTLEQRFLEGSTAADPMAPNLLVCTPTLEMGVDIGDLSATMLCSVPPEPSNYLQRVGRAGRKTGNALIFVLANARPHDLYFHTSPEEMLAGGVRPPGAFLGATEMLKRQAMAWTMDDWARLDEDAGPLPPDTRRVLSKQGRMRFPGRMLEHLSTHRDRLREGFLEVFGGGVDATGREGLAAWFQDEESGMAAHCVAAFDLVADQIRHYQGERSKALKEAKRIKEDPTLVGDPLGTLRELTRYARVLETLIEELRRRYPLEVLTDASVLPNYAFPETGVSLHSLLGTEGEDEQGERKRVYEKRAYVRPAARALTELAPFATFYAEGHKVEIRQLELGPKQSRVQRARFCPSCHHHQRVVDPTEVTDSVCPRCGHPGWKGKQQVRALLPLSTVRSVSDRVRSTTADDSEERDRQPYNLHRIFDVRPENLDGQAVRIPELGFGFEFLRQIEMVEVNLGHGRREHLQGPTVKLAGETASVDGFLACPDCGTVLDERPGVGKVQQHAPFCAQKGKDTKPRIPLYLFRRVRSEALRFLLPVSEMHVERRARSFAAAMRLALQEHFRGRPMHLRIQNMTEPRRDDPHHRKYFLVLFDLVPGGTGYLREFRDRRRVFDLLGLALQRLQECPCRARGQDGCYRCLFSASVSRYLPDLSSETAQEILTAILERREQAEVVEGGLSEAPIDAVQESELEDKFLAHLQLRLGDAMAPVDGGSAWEIQVPGATWRLTFQVDVSDLAGQPSRADAVLAGISGDAHEQMIIIECDGFAYHVQPDVEVARLRADVVKRQALAARPGVRTLTVTWHDLDPSGSQSLAPAVVSSVRDKVWDGVFRRLSPRPGDTARPLALLPTMSTMDLLEGWIRHPGCPWTAGVQALLAASLVTAASRGEVLDSAGIYTTEEHLLLAEPATPMPHVPTRSQPPTTGRWGRRSSMLTVHGLVHAPARDIRSGLMSDDFHVLLRLDDQLEARRSPDFLEAWRSFWLGWNLVQVLPQARLQLASEIESPQPLSNLFSELGLLAADSAGETTTWDLASQQPAVDVDPIIANCLDPRAADLVRALHGADQALPDLDPIELPGHLPAELTWASRRVAVCRSEDLEPDDLERIRQAGWSVHTLPVDATVVAASLARISGATR